MARRSLTGSQRRACHLTSALEEVIEDVDDGDAVEPSDFIFNICEKKGWDGLFDL